MTLRRWKPYLEVTKAHFEQRSDDNFIVTCTEPFKEAARVFVWHGGEGFFAAWHCKLLELEHMPSGRLWRFDINDWVRQCSALEEAMSFPAEARTLVQNTGVDFVANNCAEHNTRLVWHLIAPRCDV
jgi:hypothetical protein